MCAYCSGRAGRGAAAIGQLEGFVGRLRVANVEMGERGIAYWPLGVFLTNLPPFWREAMRRHVPL